MKIQLAYKMTKDWKETNDWIYQWCDVHGGKVGDTGAGFGSRDMELEIDGMNNIEALKFRLQAKLGKNLESFLVQLVEDAN